MKEWDLISAGEASVMKTRLTGQPLLTLVSANSGAFMYYTGGVITDGCFEQAELDHSVLLVGYDEDRESWKAQNSWGTGWGEEGYFHISSGLNLCGIESYPLVPVLY